MRMVKNGRSVEPLRAAERFVGSITGPHRRSMSLTSNRQGILANHLALNLTENVIPETYYIWLGDHETPWDIFARPQKWLIFAKNGWIRKISISHERLVLRLWFMAHFNRKTHFPISVSYNVYLLEQQKWLKLHFLQKSGWIRKISVPHERLVEWRWFMAHFKRKTHFSISV